MLRRIRLSDEFSAEGVEMQLTQYQHQSTPVPSTGNVFLLHGAETWTLLVADMKTLEAFHMRCQRQILDGRWWVHVFNAKVLQRSGLSTIGDSLRQRHLSVWQRCTPGPWRHDALRLMVNTYDGRKPLASWKRLPGQPRNVWLNKVQKDANAVRCGDLRSPEATERRSGPLGLRDDDDDDGIWICA